MTCLDRPDQSDWRTAPSIYIESLRSMGEAYVIDEELVRSVLARESGGRIVPANVTSSWDDTRDASAWEAADVLVAFDPDRRAVARHAKLRLILCTRAGVDALTPLDWLPPRVTLCNARGVHSSKSREFGAMAVLMLHDRVPERIGAQKDRSWRREVRPNSCGARVLIYGAGALGSAVADGLRGFHFDVVGVGRSDGTPRAGFSRIFGQDALETLLPETDVLVIAAPLTTETRGRFGQRELSLLPRGAGVLNIARGPLLDAEALATLLRTGHLSGAILDVFDVEPLPADSPLWDVPGLMVFPHVAADSPADFAENTATILARNLLDLLEGHRPTTMVDPGRGY